MIAMHNITKTIADDIFKFSSWWVTLLVLCVALLIPLSIADVPPILDYPNHLARLVLLAAGPGDPELGASLRRTGRLLRIWRSTSSAHPCCTCFRSTSLDACC